MGTGPGLLADTCCLAPRPGRVAGGTIRSWQLQSRSPSARQGEPCSQSGTGGSFKILKLLVPVGTSSPQCCKALKTEESCSLPLCRPLSNHAVLAVCKAVYYRHVNNLSQCLITWKGNRSCGSSLKSMPISLALGKHFCFFVFHSRNKYVTTDPASKGNTYL